MKRGRLILLSIFGLILVSGGIAYWRLTAAVPLTVEPLPLPTPLGEERAETETERTRKKLLGVWQDEYKGKRTMTLNVDGSGTMLVELSGAKAFLFAPKLRFDMKWHFEDDTLKMQTLGGEPEGKVNAILHLMGNTASYTLLDVSDKELLLQDLKDETIFDWRRAK